MATELQDPSGPISKDRFPTDRELRDDERLHLSWRHLVRMVRQTHDIDANAALVDFKDELDYCFKQRFRC